MDSETIKSRWRNKLPSTAHKLSIRASDLAVVLAEGCAEQFEPLRQIVADRPQSTILLPPAHVQLIVDHEPEQREEPAAEVQGLEGPGMGDLA